MSGAVTELLPIPGCETPLVFERTEDGRLLRLSAGERVYVDATQDGRTQYDGLANVDTIFLPAGFVRHVETRGERWSERHAWDDIGRITHADGTDMDYDEEGRIIACRGPGGDWHYGYAGPHLTVISGPFGLRHIIRADDGRPVAWRGDDGCGTIHYDDTGRRIGLPAKPGEWCVDGRGRLLAITDDAGRITRTLLWDRWHCLGALDGPPGSPMLEAYLLDATGTPVRRVTADGAERLPRDAFGEMLLRKGGPGLFGGAIRDGMVHLPLRRLDPITGSFDAPDPINGEAADPRRATGWTGPLPVELPAAGPYAVCRNNPVSLADPTGGISDLWWLIPSSLTWSISNTIGSLLGMWLNLQFSPIGWIVSKATNHDPFDLEWVTANNYDSFALRTDGFLAAPTHAFTYQFMMSADKKQMTDLEDARLFAPSAAFRPVLYGSVLRCVPDGTGAFLLSGQRAAPNGASLVTWTRAGGAAEPVFPGSRVPVFPAGGMHFDAVQLEIKPRPATMTELAPSGVVLTATIGDFAGLTLSGTGLGLTIGAAFALTDPAGILSAGRVLAVHEASGSTIVRTDADLTGLAAGPLTLDGLTAPSSEPLTPVPGRNQLLDITGSSLDYVPAVSVVRLSRGGPPLGAAGVSALAAGIVVDEPVPTMLAPGTPVRTAMAGGVFNGTLGPNPNDLTIVSGAVPAVGDAIVAGPAATGIAAIVTAVAASVITLDRALTPLGATGAAANWAQLAAGAEIGRLTQAPDGTATLTYAPGLPGTAPATGFVMLNGATTVARRVTSRVFDAIVLAEVLPDANPAAFTVERFKRTAPNVTNVMAASIATIALSAAPPAGVAAFQIIPFAAAAPATSGTLLAGATLAGGVASSSIAPGSGNPALRPGEAVAAVPPGGAAAVPVQITSVRLTVTFDRRVPMGAGAIEAALLALDALVYPADRVDDRILRVQPPLAGSVRLDMPRFAVGDLVVVNWPGGNQRLFTLTAVSGTTITGDTDDAVIPAGTTGITVTRLVVADPATGSSRLGINGTDAGGRQIAFDVWSPRHFGGGVIVALINGPLVRAARVDGANQPLALRLAGAAALAGSHNIASWGGTAQFAANFTIDGAVLTVTDIDVVNALTGMAGALVMPWSPGAATTTGQMLPGSVRVPEDHENASLELTRYQAVIDHELTHTLQSAKWGPLLLTAVPLWGLELGADLSAAGGPEFSPYGDATLGEGRLTFAQGAGIAANDKVQVAQNRRAVLIDLGPTVDGAVASLPDQARADLSAANITAGPVKVRKALQGTGSDVLEMFINISKFLTVGGLLNNITLASWGGIAALVTLAVQGIRSATRSRAVMSLAADRKTLTLSPAAPLDGLRSGALVAVKSGDAIVIRAIESLTDTTAVLGAPTPQFTTGTPAPLDVEISLYTPGSALFGLRDYFTAAMPDSNQPARLLFSGAGGRPTLAVHDRIDIRGVSGASQRTLVTLVDGDAIEFADPLLPANSGTNEFLVAKITSEDRTGWLDSWLLDELNIGWMQYIYDPWGHVIAEHMPDRSNIAGQVFARSAKYLFGTHSWGVPPIGYFWFDNAFRRSTAQRSQMEQEASRHSGDTYCPLGTRHGDTPFIGDVARYWVTLTGATRNMSGTDAGGLVLSNLQDAPGVSIQQGVPAAPGVPIRPGPRLTIPTGIAAAAPAFCVTDANGDFSAISSSAWVPVSAQLERSAGFSFAFTRPAGGANFRVTSIGIEGVAAAIDAQTEGAATLFFDQAPADVTVTAAGVLVSENMIFDVIPFQRVTFVAVPNGARHYRATVTRPGNLFDAADLVVTTRGSAGQEDIEISRFHAFDAATGRYASGIGPFHLPADIDIAVRRFQLRIGNTLSLRAPHTPNTETYSHRDPIVASAKPGAILFLLVPSAITPGAPTSAFAGTPPLTPDIVPAAAASDAEVIAFLGDGGALKVTLPADQPPEATADLTITLQVGPVGGAVPLTVVVSVEPHFTLDGGAAAAAGATVVLSSSDGTNLAEAGARPAEIADIAIAGAQATITLAATAASGTTVTLLLADANNSGRKARRILTVS